MAWGFTIHGRGEGGSGKFIEITMPYYGPKIQSQIAEEPNYMDVTLPLLWGTVSVSNRKGSFVQMAGDFCFKWNRLEQKSLSICEVNVLSS